MRLIGTAGHIDHGKSTLVHALTGSHPSRLPEERARGMTIDLGYAHLDHPDGFKLGIVDVPGHEKLVKNMVAGATGFELALWVVDARESVMPQSVEHLQILNLLGVRSLIPVITKAELATEAQIAGTRRDIEALLTGIRIPVQPQHVVDSVNGRGITELKQALFASAREEREEDANAPPYLSVDRVFSIRGAGTVLTGTLMRGRLREDDQLAISSLPGRWRVRSLTHHHTRVGEIGAGHRVGINLSGLSADAVRRGDAVVGLAYPYTSRFLNVELRLLDDAPFRWKHGLRLLFHAGCFEVECRLWGLVRDDEANWAQLELPKEACFFPGQRFILRNTNPLITVGGGTVLDLIPTRPRRITPAERSSYRRRTEGQPWLAAYVAGAQPPVLAIAALARRWMVPETDLRRQAEVSPELRVGPGPDALVWRTEWETELVGRLRTFVEGQPRAEQSVTYDRIAGELKLRAAYAAPLLTYLRDLDLSATAFLREHVRLERTGLVLHPGVVPWTAAERALADRFLARLAADGLRPSRIEEYRQILGDPSGLLDAVLTKLEGDGRVVRIDQQFVLDPDAAAALRQVVLGGSIEGARAGDWGRALGLSRKYSIRFLEYLNREGVLRRVGDLHFRTGRVCG